MDIKSSWKLREVAMINERVCAVVVTYNRKELLRDCLQAISIQTKAPDSILVVNNASSDGTVEMLSKEFPQVKVLNLSENVGGAGGFHEGIKWSHEQEADWTWAMDDDCIPQPETLQRLLQALALVPEKPVGALQSYQKQWNNQPLSSRRAKSILESVLHGMVWTRPSTVVMGDYSPVSIDWFQLVSVLISRSAVEKVGFPRKEFFIYGDDTDYACRIGQAGFHMYLIPWSIVNHVGGGAAVTNPGGIPPWRSYYTYRNQIATIIYNRKYIKYLNVLIALLRTSGKATARIAMSLIAGDLSTVRHVALGVLDGYCLRLGKRVQPKK